MQGHRKTRRLHWISAAALLAGMTILGATPARADIIVSLNITVGGSSASNTYNATTGTLVSGTGGITSGTTSGVIFVGSGGPGSSDLAFGGTVGGVQFKLAVNGSTNSPGTSALAFLNLTSATITNNNTTGLPTTFSVTTSATGYTAPTGTVIGNFANSGTLTNGSITNGSYSGSADGYNPTTLTFAASGSAVDVGGSDPPTLLTGFPSSSPFTATSTLTATLGLGTITSNLGGALTLTGNVVPEPATVAMALTGLPLLGLGAWIRRRRARA